MADPVTNTVDAGAGEVGLLVVGEGGAKGAVADGRCRQVVGVGVKRSASQRSHSALISRKSSSALGIPLVCRDWLWMLAIQTLWGRRLISGSSGLTPSKRGLGGGLGEPELVGAN